MTDHSEYLALRKEIDSRAKLIHQLLALAAIFWLVLLIFGYYFYLKGTDTLKMETFILLIPIIFSGLTFNYQANQFSLEAVAHYLRDQSQDKELAAGWENYYGQAKRSVELLSFLKTLPLLLPQLLPLIVIINHLGWSSDFLSQFLTVFDLLLFILVIFNFRYKLKK